AQQVPQFQSQISEIELQQLRMVDTMREEAIGESRELGFRRLELRERLVALRQQETRLEIKAPRPGTVIESTIFTIGAVVRPAEPIMYIVPTDTGLVVDARFEPTDVDNVRIGQETVLRFSALDTRTTPELFGHVIKRSDDTITDEQSGLSYYRVEVEIDEGELTKLGDQTLVAGMPVEAYIQTSKRTPLEYLVKPIADYFYDSLRSD
ncbi:MAG: HlyD family efflux transporter periplasmic adaptor subunit, partial [Pseudomonadota bacterium]